MGDDGIAADHRADCLPGPFPTAQQLIVSTASKRAAPNRPCQRFKSDPAPTTSVDFNRDIRPILERSCASCHSGEKPKGGFGFATRELALKGGQSGEPAIIPGQAERSALLRFVQDQVEDLEMPPLGRRAKFPALTKEEVAKLSGWIAQGANWPQGTPLHAPEK